MSLRGWGDASSRLFPPLVPAVAPAALLACSLRASIACQSESHSGLGWGQRKGVTSICRVACVPFLVFQSLLATYSQGCGCVGSGAWQNKLP